MNAVIFRECGNWNENLELAEVNISEPQNDKVQIKIISRPLNPSDKMFINGNYRMKPGLPQIAGLEGAGIIEACGKRVDQSLIGKHVVFRSIGTWAERINLAIAQFRLIPYEMPFEIGCQLSLNTLTAYGLLERADLSENQWLVITAASSSLSKQIIQLARIRKIKVIAIVRNDEHRNSLLKLGAKAVINSETQNIEEEINKIVDGAAVNSILDAVGGDLGSRMFNIIGPFGKIIIYGLLNKDNVSFSNGTMVYKNLILEGFGIDHWLNSKGINYVDACWNKILALIISNKLLIDYNKTFKLCDFDEAIRYYEETGKKALLL